MGHINSLAPLIDKTNTIVGLDAYGVIYNDSGIFEHAKEVIQYCDAHNIPLYVITNNATQSLSDISNHFHSKGLDIAPEQVISSGLGCLHIKKIKQILVGKKAFVYGYESSKYYAEIAGADITNNVNHSEVIVMAASTGKSNDDVYQACFAHLKNNPQVPVICINPDHYVMNSNGYYPVMGFYAHQMQYQLNRKWEWVGKPFSVFSEIVSKILRDNGHDPTNLLFCDDNPKNVKQLTQDLKCRGCVITKTGVFLKYKNDVDLQSMTLISECKL